MQSLSQQWQSRVRQFLPDLIHVLGLSEHRFEGLCCRGDLSLKVRRRRFLFDIFIHISQVVLGCMLLSRPGTRNLLDLSALSSRLPWDFSHEHVAGRENLMHRLVNQLRAGG